MTDSTHTDGEQIDEERRDLIHIAAIATAGAGVAACAVPVVGQMLPAADTKAASSLEVPIDKIAVGSEVRVLIGGKPFFVRHRTAAEIAEATNVDVTGFPDPETDADRLRPMQNGELNPAILVTSGSCTHLGCVPVGPGNNTGDYGGWYCPCHGSHYDTSGRIRKGPAPTNLPIPTYEYVSASVIKISL